jgi:HEAT repeat protein
MLRSDNRRDFNAALRELSSIPRDEAIVLLDELAVEPNGAFRCRAIDGMAKLSPERAEAIAIQLLGDSEWFVRANAIDVLSQLGGRAAAPLIARLLSTDPDDGVRSWAAFALGVLGDASVLPILVTAAEKDTGTDHEGRPIREIAVESMERIRSGLAGQDMRS